MHNTVTGPSVVAFIGAVFSSIAHWVARGFIGPSVGAFGMTDPAGHSSFRRSPCTVARKGDESKLPTDVPGAMAARSAGAGS